MAAGLLLVRAVLCHWKRCSRDKLSAIIAQACIQPVCLIWCCYNNPATSSAWTCIALKLFIMLFFPLPIILIIELTVVPVFFRLQLLENLNLVWCELGQSA